MSVPFKILLVEDNVDDEQLTLRTFRKLDPRIEVEVARDGQQALDILLNTHRPLPNLVLLDLKLPKVGGLEVLSTLRSTERTAHVSIVVLASSDEPADVRASYQRYANSSLPKPISTVQFTEVAGRLGIY